MITKAQVPVGRKHERGSTNSNAGAGARAPGPNRQVNLRDRPSTSRNNSGRKIDLHRLNTQEFNDLLDGVDVDTRTAQGEAQKAKADSSKQRGLSIVASNSAIDKSSNIYDTNDATNAPHAHEEDAGLKDNNTGEMNKPNKDAEKTTEQMNNAEMSDLQNNDDGLSGSGIVLPNVSNVSSLISNQNSQGTQTNPITVLCACNTCEAFIRDIYVVVGKHLINPNHKKLCDLPFKVTDDGITLTASPGETNDSVVNNQELIPLVRGCSIKISVIDKANLKVNVPDGDPQKILNHLMDLYFTQEDMYSMTCEGRSGSTKLPEEHAKAFKAFINIKYDKETYNFNSDLFVKFVNNKCYLVRKALWKKNPEMKQQREMARAEKLQSRKSRNNRESLAEGSASPSKRAAAKRLHSVRRARPSKFKDCKPNALKASQAVKGSSSKNHSPAKHKMSQRPTTGGKCPKQSILESYQGEKYVHDSERRNRNGPKKSRKYREEAELTISPVKQRRSPNKASKHKASKFVTSPLKEMEYQKYVNEGQVRNVRKRVFHGSDEFHHSTPQKQSRYSSFSSGELRGSTSNNDEFSGSDSSRSYTSENRSRIVSVSSSDGTED